MDEKEYTDNTNYKELYFQLFGAVSNVIQQLEDIQKTFETKVIDETEILY